MLIGREGYFVAGGKEGAPAFPLPRGTLCVGLSEVRRRRFEFCVRASKCYRVCLRLREATVSATPILWPELRPTIMGNLFTDYKGSAWLPASAGTHASGRAGQHIELFDSILGRVQKSSHTIIVCTYSMHSNAKRSI